MHVTVLDLHPRSSNLQYVFPTIHSVTYVVVLVTPMYFSGIGNDSSLATYSLTPGSTVMTVN